MIVEVTVDAGRSVDTFLGFGMESRPTKKSFILQGIKKESILMVINRSNMYQRGFKDMSGNFVVGVLGHEDNTRFHIVWRFKEKNQYVEATPGNDFLITATENNPSRIHIDSYMTSDFLDLIVFGSKGRSVIYVKALTEKMRIPGQEQNQWPNEADYDQKFNVDVKQSYLRFKIEVKKNQYQKLLLTVQSQSKISTSKMVIYERLLPIKLVLGAERYGVSGLGQTGPIFSLRADSAKYLEVDISTSKSKLAVGLLKDKYYFEKREQAGSQDSEEMSITSLKTGFNFVKIDASEDRKIPEKFVEIRCEEDCHFKVSLLDKDTVRNFELNSAKRGIMSKEIPQIKYTFSTQGEKEKIFFRLKILKLYFEGNNPKSFSGYLNENPDLKKRILGTLLQVKHSFVGADGKESHSETEMISLLGSDLQLELEGSTIYGYIPAKKGSYMLTLKLPMFLSISEGISVSLIDFVRYEIEISTNKHSYIFPESYKVDAISS